MSTPAALGSGFEKDIPKNGKPDYNLGMEQSASPSAGLPGPETILRSVAAYGSMLPSMLGGAALAFLNRDRHQVVQYGVSVWIERLFSLTGVKVEAQGEENLWKQRPAVFIFNHRSNLDPYVAIRLVHRDWGAVGKKELAGPLSGVMQWVTPNVAYLDRSNPVRAVESLRSVSALLGQGISIVIAPEGTRSRNGELGTFKRGAFRMAMDAGVPLVPIVIRDVDAVAGRNAYAIGKGTVHAAVLPPIATSDWKAVELKDRVAEVHQLFEQTLAAWPDPASKAAGPSRSSASRRRP
jgi:putative phosphoserine phosphatase/1-acylglycerol-3-phosphate O-acyltransferase